MRYILFCLLSVLCFVSVLAEEKDSLSISEQHLNGVEIVSSKPSIVKASSPLQVMTSESISALGINSVADAVKHFTGVAVKDYGGLGGLKTVSVRGFGAQHTTVAYDGLTLSNAQAGQIDLGKLAMNNVSSIALSLGMNDIFQPARNASSIALLSVETNSPKLTEKANKGNLNLQTGSFGLVGASANYVQKLNKKIVLTALLDGMRADGRYGFDVDNGSETEHRERKNNDLRSIRGEVNLYANLSSDDELKAKIYYYNSERGLPGSVILYNQFTSERLWDRNFFGQMSYKRAFSSRIAYKVLAKYSRDYMKYQYRHSDQLAEHGGVWNNEFIQNEFYLSNIFLYKIDKNISASLAEDLSYTKLDNSSMSIDILKNPVRKTSITNLALKYETERLQVVGNVYGTISQDKVKIGEKNNYKRLSPSLSTSYALLENKSLRIRASYRDVFRVPTMSEEYYKEVGKPLNPEKIRQFNMGFVWSSQVSDRVEYLRFVVDAYHANVRDKIQIIPKMGLAETSNKGKVRMNGIDVNINTQIRLNTTMALQIAGGYSYLSALDVLKSTLQEVNKAYKDQIPYTPKHSGSGSVVFNNRWVNVGYSLVFSGDRYTLPQNIKTNLLDGYADHTISANREFNLKSVKLFLQADLRNVFDKNYSVVKWYPMPGRSFTVSANIKF